MKLEELRTRADKILALAKQMDEAFNTNEGEHLTLAIMAGLKDASNFGTNKVQDLSKMLGTDQKLEGSHEWMEAYATIRHSGGGNVDWLDIGGISGDLETVKRAVSEMDKKCQAWSAENPVVRYVKVKITVQD